MAAAAPAQDLSGAVERVTSGRSGSGRRLAEPEPGGGSGGSSSVGYVLLPTTKQRQHETVMRSLAGQRGFKRMGPDTLLLPILPAGQPSPMPGNLPPSRLRLGDGPKGAAQDGGGLIPAATAGVTKLEGRVSARVAVPSARAPPSVSDTPGLMPDAAMASAGTGGSIHSTSALRLLRCWRILDSTHVASTAWYRDFYRRWPELQR
jgi:hypothetical protein